MNEIALSAPAKLNLSLKVSSGTFSSPFADGAARHHIRSEILKIALSDHLRIERIAKKKIQMHFSGPEARGVPNTSANLIFCAATAFFRICGFSEGVEIWVEKYIPLKSGLGGASSDAAATLRGLQKLFPEKGRKIPAEKWIEIAAGLGGDVPFFFSEYDHAEVSGFGEKIRPLIPDNLKSKTICVAMLPRIFCATSWAYQALDLFRKKHENVVALEGENDFEAPLFFHFPDLKKLRDTLRENGAEKSGITGSGATIYGFFPDLKSARKAEPNLRSECSFWKTLSPFR